MATDAYLGAIFLFAGNFAPRGYALCQGQTLAISSNTALFSILGTTYGGNGVTTFQLPDLRARGPIGAGSAANGLPAVDLGQIGGVQNVNILTANLPAHTHGVSLVVSNAAASIPTPDASSVLAGATDSSGNPLNLYAPGPGNVPLAPAPSGITGQNIPLNVQDPYLGLNFIICTQGIFPSRN